MNTHWPIYFMCLSLSWCNLEESHSSVICLYLTICPYIGHRTPSFLIFKHFFRPHICMSVCPYKRTPTCVLFKCVSLSPYTQTLTCVRVSLCQYTRTLTCVLFMRISLSAGPGGVHLRSSASSALSLQIRSRRSTQRHWNGDRGER